MGSGGNGHGDHRMAAEGKYSAEGKYAALYEASMDPFVSWELGERVRARGRLWAVERALLHGLDWSLPLRRRRLALALHLLVLHAAFFYCCCAFFAASTPGSDVPADSLPPVLAHLQ